MSKQNSAFKKAISKINIVKHISDNPKGFADSAEEKYLSNIPSTTNFVGEKLDALNNKLKSKRENRKDIFEQLVEITSTFLNTNRKVSDNDNIFSASRIKEHAITAANSTVANAKQIVIDNITKTLFVGEGICGTNATFTLNSLKLKPKEFDFLNTLTVEPSSAIGQIVYEPEVTGHNKEKVNRRLFDAFNSSPYNFITNDNKKLFTATWSHQEQTYNFDGLQQGSTVSVADFINDYYSSMEFPEITDIIKTTMYLTINGEGGETAAFNNSMNNLSRLLKKLMKVCGNADDRDALRKQNPVDLFGNDEPIEQYFDFNDIEGIDIDDERRRFDKVLRFTDCNNFEVKTNPTNLLDFSYLVKKDPTRAVNITINSVATNAYAQSGGANPVENFIMSLYNAFILNIPKAIITTILSAKMFLPLVMVYKMFKQLTNQVLDIKDIIKKFHKAIYAIIDELFWSFIRSFWQLVKGDLLQFISQLIKKIIKTKHKRYLLIITALISLLKKALQSELDNCYDLFNTILSTITGALAGKPSVSVPSILLLLSDKLPGYSQDRAFVNICERLEAVGIPISPIFGEANNLPLIIKSFLDGHQEEMDSNSFVKIVLKGGVLPGPTGGATIIPGSIAGTGKLF